MSGVAIYRQVSAFFSSPRGQSEIGSGLPTNPGIVAWALILHCLRAAPTFIPRWAGSGSVARCSEYGASHRNSNRGEISIVRNDFHIAFQFPGFDLLWIQRDIHAISCAFTLWRVSPHCNRFQI